MIKKKMDKAAVVKEKIAKFNEELKGIKFSSMLKGKISEKSAKLIDKFMYLMITGLQEDVLNILKFMVRVSNLISKFKSFAWIILFFMLLSTYKGMAEVFGYEQVYTYITFLIMWYIVKLNYNIGVIRSEVESYVKESKKEGTEKAIAN